MNLEERKALRDAVEKRRKGEPLEKSLGRALRRAGLDFETYVRVIGETRALAQREKVTLEEAALALASKEE
jgi:hypothetical protein